MTNMTKKIVLIASVALVVIVATVLVLGILQSGESQDPQLSGTEGTTTATQGSVNDSTQGTNSTQGGTNDPTQGGANDPTEGATPTEPPHSHSYSGSVTKDATCTTMGVKTYTCACGDSYTEEIEKLDHNYTSKTVDPTCTTKGYTTHTCACGHSYQDNETKATGHSWGDWTDAGEGKSTRQCSACGKKETKTENSGTTGTNKIDPNGDPNGNPTSYVAPADPKTGISWDGVSPIIYTYADGTTGTEPKLGATYYINPYMIGTVNAYTLGQQDPDEFLGGGSDGSVETCRHCGKPSGDGTNGTCVHWMVEGTHTCKHCGEAVPGKTCHTCDK